MDDIYLSEICEIFHHAALNDGISIAGISERTGISREVIRNILLYFYEFPFGGISINCSGLPGNIDISQIDEDVLDESVRWNVEIKDMDKIPVENLDEHEKYVLSILLDRAVRDNKDMLLLNETSSKISITTKGVCGRTADVFKLKHYPLIKRALIRELSIEVVINSSLKARVLRPLGIVYHSEKSGWYLICMDEDEKIHPYPTDYFSNLRLGKGFVYPKDFNMKEFLNNYFDMEQAEEEYIEVLFKNEGSVVEKASRRLQGIGDMTCLGDGSIFFKGNLIGLKEFKNWILGFGSSAVVVEPVWMRDDIVRIQREVINNYSNLNVYREKVSRYLGS